MNFFHFLGIFFHFFHFLFHDSQWNLRLCKLNIHGLCICYTTLQLIDMEVRNGQFNESSFKDNFFFKTIYEMRRLKRFSSRKIVNVIMFIIWIYYEFLFQFWEKLLSHRYGGCYSVINLKCRIWVKFSRAVSESSKSFYEIELMKMRTSFEVRMMSAIIWVHWMLNAMLCYCDSTKTDWNSK